MMTEYRLEAGGCRNKLEKRGHILSGTLLTDMEGGIEALRAKCREAVQRPAIPEG